MFLYFTVVMAKSVPIFRDIEKRERREKRLIEYSDQ